MKKLFRSKNKVIAGVCGGIAEYLSIDPTIVRIIWVLVTLFYGIGLLAYIIIWILTPER
jgi:phage shock protein C